MGTDAATRFVVEHKLVFAIVVRRTFTLARVRVEVSTQRTISGEWAYALAFVVIVYLIIGALGYLGALAFTRFSVELFRLWTIRCGTFTLASVYVLYEALLTGYVVTGAFTLACGGIEWFVRGTLVIVVTHALARVVVKHLVTGTSLHLRALAFTRFGIQYLVTIAIRVLITGTTTGVWVVQFSTLTAGVRRALTLACFVV